MFGKIRSKSQDFSTQASLCAEVVNFPHNYNSNILSEFNADTKSNLRFEVFEGFCATIGINSVEFEPYKNFINKILCDRRNSVAHGEEMRLNVEDFNINAEKMKTLIDSFTSSLTKCVSSRAYLVPTKSQLGDMNSSQTG